jgi:wyosine [tRNA(Phe)-imidazoG37] synthetase (radical SAM superfamily)
MAHVFGPVPSRRLGRSLGVDVVPYKTCPYDCIYCQIGRTTDALVEGREFVPLEDVLADVREKLDTQPDYITLSGSGEPTLYTRIGALIDGIRAMTDIPVAVLTNGALLWREDVRARLENADLVAPSLDAPDAETWQTINRPAAALDFDTMLQGLIDFRKAFKGGYWLEVFIVRGLNDSDAAIEKLADHARRIRPDRLQLNTVTRPPADPGTPPVSRQELERIAARFEGPVEVIASFKGEAAQKDDRNASGRILETLHRRPCTAGDLAAGLALSPAVVREHLNRLEVQGLVTSSDTGGECYYQPVS